MAAQLDHAATAAAGLQIPRLGAQQAVPAAAARAAAIRERTVLSVMPTQDPQAELAETMPQAQEADQPTILELSEVALEEGAEAPLAATEVWEVPVKIGTQVMESVAVKDLGGEDLGTQAAAAARVDCTEGAVVQEILVPILEPVETVLRGSSSLATRLLRLTLPPILLRHQ